MSIAIDFRALHFEHQHQCCRIIGDYEQCGLWCGHDGDHTPRVGEYLPPPIISEVWILQFRQQITAGALVLMSCPLCGARPPADQSHVSPLLWEPRFVVESGPRTLAVREWEGSEQITTEMPWRFEPCGCEGREILNN